MNLGESILAAHRYNFKSFGVFAWWRDEQDLENFLQQSPHRIFNEGWHVRLKLYRRWGEIGEIKEALVDSTLAVPQEPVVAVTLARLKLWHLFRFIKWGKPVETQVRNSSGQRLALAALRPLNTFSTFSIWENEAEMVKMVQGRMQSHQLAMQERNRQDFHYEFTTLRFRPIKEVGTWNGQSGFTYGKSLPRSS